MIRRTRWLWSAGVAAAVLALGGVISLHYLPARAATTSNSPYTQPTWWAKYQVVSAPGFAPAAPGHNKSVSVGANVDVSNESGPQSETSIAINPSNPSALVAGSNEIFRLPMRGYFSADGGANWGAVDLPLPPGITTNGTDFGSDPGVAWDTRGNVYYSYIVVFFNRTFSSIQGTEMAVARSSDGGQTWTPTYFAQQNGTARFNDKPMIAVDTNPASPFRDTVYVAWDTASSGSSSTHDVIQVSHSSDGGQTFSAPVAVSDIHAGQRGVIGADPFVGPDGTLFVAWNDIVANTIAEASSPDGGVTFGPTHTVAQKQAAFDVGIPAMSTRRALVYPACGADASTGTNRGTLYCSWMDVTASNGTDIFVARSHDAGATWSAQMRVNDDPTGVANDQFNQWLAVDSATGAVNLSWNDTRNDPTHLSTDIFYTRSIDGGQTFTSNVQVTSAPTNESCCGADLGNQYGDYEGIAALNGVVHPVWTDRRASVTALDEEVFTATLTTK
ncbi:MAG TPA: sialidase family protein [Ktedonobacterales bacterium]